MYFLPKLDYWQSLLLAMLSFRFPVNAKPLERMHPKS